MENKKTTVVKNSERCMHITEKGERCKNKKMNGELEHCGIHSINPKKVLTKKSPEGSKTDAPKVKKDSKKEKS